MKAGVSLNPHTPIAVLEDIIARFGFGTDNECKSWFWRTKFY